MSTTPVTPAPANQGLTNFVKYFNAVAAVAAATIAQEQADIVAKDHIAAVNDAVLGAATAVQAVLPGQNANIVAALGLFSVGETLVTSLVALFHHKKG